MFDRFTDRARKVMGLAYREAHRFGHGSIGVEHFLLGLLGEGSGVAADVLEDLDVDPRSLRREVEIRMTRGSPTEPRGQLPFTPRAKKTLEFALQEASGLGHNYIGTEHLLLGLIREEKGIAAQVLSDLGVRLVVARATICQLLGVDHDAEVLQDLSARNPESEDEPGPLDPRARAAMELAALLARHRGHEAIGTEHILIGIIDEGPGGSELPRLLLARLRAETEKLTTPGDARVLSAPVALTPAARSALDHAFLAARDTGSAHVGIGHLLAGLIRERDGIAARVLSAAGIRAEDALAHARGGPNPPSLDVVEEVIRSLAGPRDAAMRLARLEARRFQHDCIDTEHVLLGLLAAGGAAVELLRRLGIDPERVHADTAKRMTRGKATPGAGQLPFAHSVKTALELALGEARTLGHVRIGDEHLLLGLALEAGTAAQVLAAVGATADALRDAIASGPPAPPE